MTDNNHRPKPPGGGDGADAFTPGPAQIMAAAVAGAVRDALARELPQAIAMALRPLLPEPVLCSACLSRRYTWEVKFERELVDALAAACIAHGIPPGSPQAGLLDPAPHLPPQLQPGADPDGLPPLRLKTTTVNGTDYCTLDLPGLPQSGPARREYLIASGPWTPGMLSQLARQGAAG